jgi:hypothetical protein
MSFEDVRAVFAQITAKAGVNQAAAETCRALTAYGQYEKLVSDIADLFNISNMFENYSTYMREIYERGMPVEERFKDAAMETALELKRLGYVEVASELTSAFNIPEQALADKKTEVEKRSTRERLDIMHYFETIQRGETIDLQKYGEWLNVWIKKFSEQLPPLRTPAYDELHIARQLVFEAVREYLRKKMEGDGPTPTM